MGNEKDPSAALGMTKRGVHLTFFFSAQREPNSAPAGHLPPALPPKGEARRYAANDFLNLIGLP